MDLILLAILCYALYRMALGYNINPWKWILRLISVFMLSAFILSIVLYSIYGESFFKDMQVLQKVSLTILPFTLLWEMLLFFFFRSRIISYVHELDKIDNPDDSNNNHTPGPPKSDKKDPEKDFSYFR